jgi:hypothetical protein
MPPYGHVGRETVFDVIWRSGRDSNPRYGFSTVQRFSKPPPSASRPPLQMKKLQPRHYQFPFTLRQMIEWETRLDSFGVRVYHFVRTDAIRDSASSSVAAAIGLSAFRPMLSQQWLRLHSWPKRNLKAWAGYFTAGEQRIAALPVIEPRPRRRAPA